MTVHEIPVGRRVAGVPPWQGGYLLKRPPAYAWRADPMTPTDFTVHEEGRVVIELRVRPGHILQRAALMDALVDHLNST